MHNSFCHPYLLQSISEEPSNFEIDTDCFTRPDLALFVESLETISRLEREKYERRQRRIERKLPKKCPLLELVEQMRKITECAEKLTQTKRIQEEQDSDCTLSAPSGDEAQNEQIIELEAKQLPRSANNTPVKQIVNRNGKVSPTQSAETDFDENYFSAPSSRQNSPRSSIQVEYTKKYTDNKQSSSDSEESGVFPVHTEQCNVDDDIAYENIPLQPRPRSVVITKPPKQRTMRSRIIGLVLKREYEEDSDTKSEHKQTKKQLKAERKRAKAAKRRDERRERLIDNLLKQSMSSLATKSNVRRAVAIEDGSVEERFLNKALRYLTL